MPVGGARREGRKEGEGEASARVVSSPRESKEADKGEEEELKRKEVPTRLLLLLLLVLLLVLLSLPARKGGVPRERRRRRRVAVKVLVMLATSKRTLRVMSMPVDLPRSLVCCVCVNGVGRWKGAREGGEGGG